VKASTHKALITQHNPSIIIRERVLVARSLPWQVRPNKD